MERAATIRFPVSLKRPAGRRRVRSVALGLGAAVVVAASFGAGILVGRSGHNPAVAGTSRIAAGARTTGGTSQLAAPNATAPEGAAKQFAVFSEAWNFVENEYYRQPVDRDRLIQGAIKGMLNALNDQHASYLDRNSTRIEKAHQDGIFEGIGASVEIKERRFIILAPVEDSPAARAGLRTGDVILRIDGKEVGTANLAEVVAMLRGPAGTKVKLTVQRPEDPEAPPVEMELTRARIEIESVSSKMVAEGIGYIRIRIFGSQTVPQLSRVLREMRAKRVRGLIIDLRDNPGGYVNSAVDVSSQFLKDGSVVVYEEHDGKRTPSLARGGGLATDLTLAVLVNRGSASASEIVAGALRDHERAVLIGESTFGKGSVQLPHDLSDGSSVRVTVGNWQTPSGRVIQGQGLSPTIEAKPTAEDESNKRDVALDKALEWFRAAPLATPEAAIG